MSRFSFHVYGTPDGFDSLYEDKDDELGAFYDGSKENVKLTIHYNRNKREVSYNYLRYNYMSASKPPRSGAFWGISLVCHGCYIFDVNSLFNVFDGLFRQILVDAKLFKRAENANVQAVFLVRKFEDAKSYLEHIGNDLIRNVSSWGEDVKTLDFSFSQKSSNNLLQVGFSVVQDDVEAQKYNEEFEKLLNKYSWISLSPEYVVNTPEKMNPNDVSKYRKLAKRIHDESVHLLASLLNPQKTKEEKNSACKLLSNYVNDIDGAVYTLSGYRQHQQDVDDVFKQFVNLKDTLGNIDVDNYRKDENGDSFWDSDDGQIEEWKNNIEELEQKMSQLRDILGTSHADLKQISAQIENLQKEVLDLKKALDQQQRSERIDNLNESLCNIQVQIIDLQKQLKNPAFPNSYAKYAKMAIGIVVLLLIVVGGMFVSNSWSNIESLFAGGRIDEKNSIQQIQQEIENYLVDGKFEDAFDTNRKLEDKDAELYSKNLQKIKENLSDYVDKNSSNPKKKEELEVLLKCAKDKGFLPVNEKNLLAGSGGIERGDEALVNENKIDEGMLRSFVDSDNFVSPWRMCEQAAQSGENVEELKRYLKECFKSYVKIANNISFDEKWEKAGSIKEYEEIVKDNFNSFAKGRIYTVNKNQNQEALKELKNYKDKPYACDLKDEISKLTIKSKEVNTVERKVKLSSPDDSGYSVEKIIPENNRIGGLPPIKKFKLYELKFPKGHKFVREKLEGVDFVEKEDGVNIKVVGKRITFNKFVVRTSMGLEITLEIKKTEYK